MNDHKLGGSKQQKFILSQFWRPESLKWGCWQGWFLLEAVKENLFLAPLLASVFPANLGCFLACTHAASISTCIFTWYPTLCPLLLTRTLVPGFRAHASNPGWPRLETPNLMTPAKTFFPNQVTRWTQGWGCGHIYLRATIQSPAEKEMGRGKERNFNKKGNENQEKTKNKYKNY